MDLNHVVCVLETTEERNIGENNQHKVEAVNDTPNQENKLETVNSQPYFAKTPQISHRLLTNCKSIWHTDYPKKYFIN